MLEPRPAAIVDKKTNRGGNKRSGDTLRVSKDSINARAKQETESGAEVRKVKNRY